MSVEAQDALRTLIQTGAITVGDVLIVEDVAARLALPIHDVALAAANLEAFGLLEAAGESYVVRGLDGESVRRFIEMRLEIEVRVVETLARVASGEDIAKLRYENDALRLAALRDERVKFMEVSARFHQTLAERANFLQGARVLRNWEDFQKVVGARALEKPQAMLEAIIEHEDLIGLIESGDSTGAASAMRDHLTRTFDRAREAVAA